MSRACAVPRGRLRQLFQRGRISLVIGFTSLTVSLFLGDILARLLGQQGVGEIVRESLLVGGWVAMWRPLEVFRTTGGRTEPTADSRTG